MALQKDQLEKLIATLIDLKNNKKNSVYNKKQLHEIAADIGFSENDWKEYQLELDKRPFVQLIPHPDPGRCDGITLLVDNLKNNESLAEYELEYMAGPLIQGVFGRRDFTEVAEHQPLELGSCSKGKCKCDTDITGGSLTLSFQAQ